MAPISAKLCKNAFRKTDRSRALQTSNNRLARNFAKTHFRQCATFVFSTSQISFSDFFVAEISAWKKTHVLQQLWIFWMSPADPSRKMTPDDNVITFKSQRTFGRRVKKWISPSFSFIAGPKNPAPGGEGNSPMPYKKTGVPETSQLAIAYNC